MQQSMAAFVLRLLDRGDTAVGKRADVVLLAEDYSVVETVAAGLWPSNRHHPPNVRRDDSVHQILWFSHARETASPRPASGLGR